MKLNQKGYLKDQLINELLFIGIKQTRFGIDKRMNLCNDCLKDFWKWLENHKEK